MHVRILNMNEMLFVVKYPKWFNIYLTVSCIAGILLFITLIFLLFILNMFSCFIFLVFLILVLFAALLLRFVAFYYIIVYNSGILSYNIKKKSKFAYWHDIVLVRRALNYPLSAVILFVTKDNRKIYAISDMVNFEKLLITIKEKNPNVQVKMKYRSKTLNFQHKKDR